ncbi:MAG: hypothetical protein E7473_11455 [Ruminococcaceae bacterium]|nr:hypothetical protein [Oscillospiraceae bacterium]
MKRKLLGVILIVMIAIGLSACGKKNAVEQTTAVKELDEETEYLEEAVQNVVEKETTQHEDVDEEITEEYPMIDVDTLSAEECEINISSNSDIIIDCVSWYEGKSAAVRWYRDNGVHWTNIRKVSDFDDYGNLFTKEDDRYVWTETVLYSDEGGDGWEFSGDSEQGETKINIGKLESGKYILIVCNDFGTQFGAIMQKYNITVG